MHSYEAPRGDEYACGDYVYVHEHMYMHVHARVSDPEFSVALYIN